MNLWRDHIARFSLKRGIIHAALSTGEVVPKWHVNNAVTAERMYREQVRELQDRISALAAEHGQPKLESARHAIDLTDSARFYCLKCALPWPCPPLRWATGRDFAPLRLEIRGDQ